MRRETELHLIDRLIEEAETGGVARAAAESRIPVDAYTSPTIFEAERTALFRESPVIVAHSSELAAPGDFVTHDALGVPIFVVRSESGAIRGFLNVCRHRGARLTTSPTGNKRAFVCGYHGWTYALNGTLLHVPHAEGFSPAERRGLVPIAVFERAGFVWVVPTPRPSHGAIDVAAFLGPLDEELAAFDLSRHKAFRTVHVERRFNWKLIIDAFLDGYHIKRLHQDSVYRFFLDNVNLADPMGPHIRSAVARKGLEKIRQLPREAWHFRDVLSLTYFLFPNTVLVFHPDWVSRITVFPLAVDRTLFTHTMIVPPDADTDDRLAHWDKTWRLIHENVFEREDMVAAEWIQSGLHSGANVDFICGSFEFPIRWFHDRVDHAIAVRARRGLPVL